MPSLDLMHKFDRLALRWYQIKPAPRDHQIRRQSEDAVRDGIAVMMIVKKPRVDVAFVQCRLDGGQVHGQTSIVNNGPDLSESAGVEGSG